MTEKIEITQSNYSQILGLANSSNSRTDLLKKLGWGRNSNYLKKLDELLLANSFNYKIFPVLSNSKNAKVIEAYTVEKLKDYIAKSHSYAGLLRLFDKAISGGSVKILKRYIKENDIDISHFNSNNKYYNPEYSTYRTDEEVFIENSQASTSTAKTRILKYHLMEYKCHGKGCNLRGDWLGNKITLQLEHKNGNNRDHRLENLEFLCPNCHSVTLTWGARNIKNRQEKKKSDMFIKKIQLDKENFLENILPQCANVKEVFKIYKIPYHGRSYEGLDVILKENFNHLNVIEFIKKKKVKLVNYPPLSELLEMVKTNGFSKSGRELACSDNAIRKYLIKQKIDIKSLK